jgi:hypothetical protein
MNTQVNRSLNLRLNLFPSNISTCLLKILSFVILGHITVHIASAVFDIQNTPFVGLYRFFDMRGEANLPSYISALNLIFASLLCFLIDHKESFEHRRKSRYWLGLAFGLMLMSFDEAAMIHDGIVGDFLNKVIEGGEGILHYKWYIPYVPLVLILGYFYIPFLRRLPIRQSRLFIISGLVYLGGALGVEMVESYFEFYGGLTLAGRSMMGVNALIEESMEMTGIIILIYGLLCYLADSDHDLVIQFRSSSNDLDE